jgi:hypothetical protein
MPQEMTALAHMRLLGSSGDRRPWSKGVSACASMCLQSETVASRLLLPRHILPLRYADFLSDCPNVFRMLGVCALRSCGVPAELRLVLNLQFNSPVSQSCTSDQDIPTSIGVRRVPDHNDVLEVQLDEHFSEIVGVLIHIVALPRLVGAAKTAAVMATKLAITFTVGGCRIFHQQVSVLGRVTMRLIWILSREGPCARLSVVGACVPRAACAFLAGGPLGVRR